MNYDLHTSEDGCNDLGFFWVVFWIGKPFRKLFSNMQIAFNLTFSYFGIINI